MTEIQPSPEQTQYPNTKSLVKGVVRGNRELFFGNNPQYSHSITKVYSTNLLRELNAGLLDVEQEVFTLEYKRSRVSDGHWYIRSLKFLVNDNTLIPLGTHVHDQKDYQVYHLKDSNTSVLSSESLDQHILTKLPENIVLTRVLSEKEAKKFENGDKSLGSTHQLFWKDVVHTAVTSITNEFEHQEGYEKAIKAKFTKPELAKLVGQGQVRFYTYEFAFKNRSPESPFPFDLEAVFSVPAIPTLLAGYHSWAQDEGSPYINNPFY